MDVWHTNSEARLKSVDTYLDCVEVEKRIIRKDGKERIADSFVNTGLFRKIVVEFQNEVGEFKELLERTNFYSEKFRLIWIFNKTDLKLKNLTEHGNYYRLRVGSSKNIPSLFKTVRERDYLNKNKLVDIVLDLEDGYYKIVNIEEGFFILEKFDRFDFIISYIIGKKFINRHKRRITMDLLNYIFNNKDITSNKKIRIRGVSIDKNDLPILKSIILHKDGATYTKNERDIIFKYEKIFYKILKPVIDNKINHNFLKDFEFKCDNAIIYKGIYLNGGFYQMLEENNKDYGNLQFRIKDPISGKHKSSWWIREKIVKKKKFLPEKSGIFFCDERAQRKFLEANYTALFINTNKQ